MIPPKFPFRPVPSLPVGWRAGLWSASLAVWAALAGGCASAPATPAPVLDLTAAVAAPPGTPPRSGQPAPPTASYEVRKGDTLFSIAWGLRLDYQEVAEWNGIAPPYRIQPGQRLRLSPPPRERGPTVTPLTPPEGPQVAAIDPAPRPAAVLVPLAKEPGPEPPVAEPARVQLPEPSPPAASPSVAPARAAVAPAVVGAPAWKWPTAGTVAERFAPGDNITGVRIVGKLGQPIRAAEAGEVIYSDDGFPQFGRLVVIQHNKELLSAYGWVDKVTVKQGDRVAKGAQIAAMGLRGANPLLHFEIRRGGKPIDPLPLLPKTH